MSYEEYCAKLAKVIAKAIALRNQIDDPTPSSLWQDKANIHLDKAISELRQSRL